MSGLQPRPRTTRAMITKPYWPILDIPEGMSGDFSIRHRHYPAETVFSTTNPRSAFLAGHAKESVRFGVPVRYHELYHRLRGTWMTDVPVEQAQANSILNKYEGTVLVGGLGLGYAALRIALLPLVKKVVVIEIAPEVIELVEPYLPAEARKKITVVEDDLLKYLVGNVGTAYDHAFYDIWQSDGEGTFFEIVVPLLRATTCVFHRPDCWNEDVMRAQLFFSLHSRATKSLFQGTDDQVITLDGLCEERNSIWWDWSVLFFRWYREQDLKDKEWINKGMACYAQSYGRPFFAEKWPDMIKIYGP